MKLTHLLMLLVLLLVLLLVHAMMTHLIHGSHLVHRVHRMHGIHLIHLTHFVHLMHGVHLIHLMHVTHLVHGIHAAASRVGRHSSLQHVALFSHAITSVHAHVGSWAHVHLLVGVVHAQILGPHGTTLVSTITTVLPVQNNKKFSFIILLNGYYSLVKLCSCFSTSDKGSPL